MMLVSRGTSGPVNAARLMGSRSRLSASRPLSILSFRILVANSIKAVAADSAMHWKILAVRHCVRKIGAWSTSEAQANPVYRSLR
ncbi:hypothetical protein OE88DRAFT_1660226 [Heliocybe sulcata]|uniref:Uncharacterized protein n=1 Tax=Heliocybe sulcata TaxID=5364 RepID=A0A5C3N1V9_9AGAM|nr:hypothetical protein OE88DRAFT_1660226 [Heliocybe sulcata]